MSISSISESQSYSGYLSNLLKTNQNSNNISSENNFSGLVEKNSTLTQKDEEKSSVYYSWQIDNIKEEIKTSVMNDMGVDSGDLLRMTDVEKSNVEKQIATKVNNIFKEQIGPKIDESVQGNMYLSGQSLNNATVSALLTCCQG